MQRFISDGLWDEEQMRWNYHQLVADEMGEPEGVLMFDETGLVKKGQDSVGVARQYCGTLGKVENGQVGVFAAYASRQGYALVDNRLFLPEAWFWRRVMPPDGITCRVPDTLQFQSKTPIGGRPCYRRSCRTRSCRSSMWLADCLYGNSPDFLDAVDACVGVTTLVAIPSETRCWRQRPQTRTRPTPIKEPCAPACEWGASTPAPAPWRPCGAHLRRRVGSSAPSRKAPRGPSRNAFARQRVTLCKEDLPDRTVWLVIKRKSRRGTDRRLLHQ